jgi:hypothetical protein
VPAVRSVERARHGRSDSVKGSEIAEHRLARYGLRELSRYLSKGRRRREEKAEWIREYPCPTGCICSRREGGHRLFGESLVSNDDGTDKNKGRVEGEGCAKVDCDRADNARSIVLLREVDEAVKKRKVWSTSDLNGSYRGRAQSKKMLSDSSTICSSLFR